MKWCQAREDEESDDESTDDEESVKGQSQWIGKDGHLMASNSGGNAERMSHARRERLQVLEDRLHERFICKKA